MKIFGYSERGIINSLIFSIGEDVTLMTAFMKLISLPKAIEVGNPIEFDILLEQSFSEFGDSDLVLIAKYEDNTSKVFFIEGKVKTSLANWGLQKQYDKYLNDGMYKGYSSNLFYQLYLKSLLFENLSLVTLGVEDKLRRTRKIGKNKVVEEALKMVCTASESYYIGIIPSSVDEISEFINGNKKEDVHYISWSQIYHFCTENKLQKVLDIFKYNEGQIY